MLQQGMSGARTLPSSAALLVAQGSALGRAAE